jgi:uncharacterized protein
MTTLTSEENEASLGNQLFPVFFKLNQLSILIVGGGNIGLEKITAVLNNSPGTDVTLVARKVHPAIKEFQREYANLQLIEREFLVTDMEGKDLVIAATGDRAVSELIRQEATARKILINVADTPDLCDFYLGAIVQKGDLKIAISTNGKSPTVAKRLKEIFNEELNEDDLQLMLNNLNKFRNHLKGDFDNKVKQLNLVTASLVEANNIDIVKETTQQRILKIVGYSLTAISLMLLGHLVFTLLPFSTIGGFFTTAAESIDSNILYFIVGGAVAQLIDGALGMAYGVSVTTFLLSLGMGITPAVASASMHAAEVFTTGTSSVVYMKMKSVNIKLFKTLLIPGAVGAILGALIISYLSSKDNFHFVRPLVSIYTLVLGVLILRKALKEHVKIGKKIKHIKPVAFFGGLLDSIGGGGWGPIVTTSLIAGGRDFRYAVGSSHMAKFFVATISTLTFIATIGLQHWQIILGLVIGSMSVAPFSIYLSTKISKKWGLILVGFVVIIVSLKTFVVMFLN